MGRPSRRSERPSQAGPGRSLNRRTELFRLHNALRLNCSCFGSDVYARVSGEQSFGKVVLIVP